MCSEKINFIDAKLIKDPFQYLKSAEQEDQ